MKKQNKNLSHLCLNQSTLVLANNIEHDDVFDGPSEDSANSTSVQLLFLETRKSWREESSFVEHFNVQCRFNVTFNVFNYSNNIVVSSSCRLYTD